jgi:hypothetical protein
MIKHITFGLLIGLTCLHAFAQSASGASTSEFAATSQPHYCPALNELTFDSTTRIWSAAGGWKSYDQSFAKEINQFLGAQWIGIQVGQIACIYAGKDQYTFPIVLVHNTLIQTPTGGAWEKNTNDGHYHCIAHQISQCPFYPVTSAKNDASDENLIDTIRHNPVQSQMNF